MVDFEIVKAEEWHAIFIAASLRDSDRVELEVSGRTNFEEVLKRSVSVSSSAWTALINGVPSIIFGVAPVSVLSGIGAPWLLATNSSKLVRRKFLIDGMKYVEQMKNAYPRLMNLVHEKNQQSIRWLKWLGFDIMPPIPFGTRGELFHPFEMRG